jgi:hypothetical protein
MLASIRVTKAGHFLDASMHSSTIIYPGSIWFKSQPWTEYGRSQYAPTFPMGINEVTFTFEVLLLYIVKETLKD